MFLADENINAKIIRAIRNSGIDVISICEEYPGITDEGIINLSLDHPKIILTEDKDFGEWVFAHDYKKISVILLRYHHKDLNAIISALLSLINKDINVFFGKFITITKNKIRIRQIK